MAVISDGYWRRTFGRGREAIGAILTFDERAYTIVGITPRGFSGPDPSAADVWVPLTHAATARRGAGWQDDNDVELIPLVRLATGVTVAAANAAATSGLRGVRAAAEFRDRRPTVLLGPLLATRGPGGLGGTRLSLIVGGVSVVILLIAIANVTTLLLLRAAGRRRELAVRVALGAGRWRVGRLLVLESVALAVASGLAALVVATLAGRALRRTLLPDYQWTGGPIDARVFLFAGLTALVVGLVAGLVPALQVRGTLGVDELRASGRSARAARSPVRATLLVLQAALSVVLVIGAAVFFRSYDAARQLDVGYAKEHLLTVRLDGVGFEEPPRLDERAVTAVADRLRAVPGVRAVAQKTSSPMGSATARGLRVAGFERLPIANGPYQNHISANFLEVAGLDVLAGRGFTPADRAGAPKVALVNETFARLVWPTQSAIGHCLYVGDNAADCSTVVGVIEAPREFGLRDDATFAQYYIPIAQARVDETMASMTQTRRTLIARTTGDPGVAVGPALLALDALFPDLPRNRVRSLPAVYASRIRSWRVGTGLFAAAALFALLLAAIGLYSTIGFGVRQREFEFGIRRALGAQAAHLMRLVLVQGFGWAAAGVVADGLVALWAGRFVAPLLFDERSPRDAMAYAVATAVLLLAALAASLLPARRAATADPTQALRAE